jgi:hypothetical protein
MKSEYRRKQEAKERESKALQQIKKPRLLEFQEVLRTVREHPPYQTCCVGNGMFSDNRARALSHWRPVTAAASSLAVVSLGAVPELRLGLFNRCRRKRQGPSFFDTRGMGPNKDRRDSHGSIRQAHLPDAQSEGGAGPTTEWDKDCKRD